jgi:hypothetical protein
VRKRNLITKIPLPVPAVAVTKPRAISCELMWEYGFQIFLL